MIIKNISDSFFPFFGLSAPDTHTFEGMTTSGLNAGNEFDVYSVNTFSQVSDEDISKGIEEDKLCVIWKGKQLSKSESLSFMRSMGTDKIDPSVQTKSDLNSLSVDADQVVYVCDIDSNFKYTGSAWVQCGENTILREGLVKGAIYVNQVKIG